MALLKCEYFSVCLAGRGEFYIALPNDVPPMLFGGENPAYKRPMKTLVLLHGYNGTASDWLTGSAVNELAGKYNIAIIMPSGRNSFYVDKPATGEWYGKFVGDELINYCRKTFGLSDKAEDTYIGGFSMGGFGAIRNALKYGENYSKVIALSSALITSQLKEMTPEMQNPMANYEYYVNTFGDLKNAENTDASPEFLVKELKAAGKKTPKIFMACGSEDFLIERNKAFDAFLTENGVEHEFHVSPGMHNWTFWNEYIEPGIKYCVED